MLTTRMLCLSWWWCTWWELGGVREDELNSNADPPERRFSTADATAPHFHVFTTTDSNKTQFFAFTDFTTTASSRFSLVPQSRRLTMC